MSDYYRISEETESSIEVIHAIAELVGDDEQAIRAEWRNPRDPEAIMRRAREIAGDEHPLVWGPQGGV